MRLRPTQIARFILLRKFRRTPRLCRTAQARRTTEGTRTSLPAEEEIDLDTRRRRATVRACPHTEQSLAHRESAPPFRVPPRRTATRDGGGRSVPCATAI